MRTSKIPDAEFYREYGADPNFIQMAVSWAVSYPVDFLLLTAKRIKYFWYEIPEQSQNSWPYLFHIWSFVALLPLAILGVCWPREKFEKVSLVLLFIVIYPVLFYLTHVTHYRHRFHIEPFILVIATHGFYRLWALRLKLKAAPLQSGLHIEQSVQKGGANAFD